MPRKRSNWEQWELALIKEKFPTLGAKGLAELLPNHTYGSISKKAQQMGIKCDRTEQRKLLGLKKVDAPRWVVRGFNGYLYYYVNGDRNNKVPLHRYIMEQHLGRKLNESEIVHHINGNKYDNRIENLELTTRSEHMNKHRSDLKPNKI